MRSVKVFRDPAPSRSAYRLQRLMLTPLFRTFLRVGLPLGAVFLGVSIYLADSSRREAILETAAEMRRQIEERPEFMVNLMAIDGATGEVAEDIREILPIDFPVSSFDLDLNQIKARAEELDAVARADVRVQSGGVLQIEVSERIPAVIWRSRDGLELLDSEGHRVAEMGARSDRSELPLLAGRGADAAVPEALAILAAAGPIRDRIRGLLRVGQRRWDIVLDRDQRILLPESGAAPALDLVLALDGARNLLNRDVAVIDMRNPDRPTLRLGADALDEMRQSNVLLTGAN
jgi:cell division protein FtsQ